MKFIFIILVVCFINACITHLERQADLISDPSYGLILLDGSNYGAPLAADVSVRNITSEETFSLAGLLSYRKANEPKMYKLKPGTYRLYQYQLYLNVKPKLDYINYLFTVEAGKVNYVGDWYFREVWDEGRLVNLKFSVKYNDKTVSQAHDYFKHVLDNWKIKKVQ